MSARLLASAVGLAYFTDATDPSVEPESVRAVTLRLQPLVPEKGPPCEPAHFVMTHPEAYELVGRLVAALASAG